jgi:hypothetical protein
LSYDINIGYLLTADKELELVECKFGLEDKLQETVEKSIKLLEKVFGTELLNCGKVSFPEGLEADLILLSKEEREEGVDYIPIVLELKRMDNREIRREVLAQLLEYMTAIYLHPQQVIQACQNRGVNFDIENLKKNIEERRIRGIILSERIPEIVKKTIELLNEELSNLELYGIEFKRLCSSDGKYNVIIPVLIGATTEAERKKKKSTRILWTYDKLRQVYNDIEDELLRRRLLDLLEWARVKGVLEEYPSNQPRFRIFQDIITVEPSGKLYVRFGRNHESKLPKPRRQKLLEELQELGMLPSDIGDADSVLDGKGTLRSIAELSEEEFKRLKELFENLFL